MGANLLAIHLAEKNIQNILETKTKDSFKKWTWDQTESSQNKQNTRRKLLKK